MPVVSYFGALVINPIINNYCHALTLAHGLFASIIVTLYFVQFSVFLYKQKCISGQKSIGYGCMFILLHFISHMGRGHDNFFLLGTVNLTCVYNYTLAAVLNASLVMHFMSYGGLKSWFKDSSLLHKIIVLIWTYFALFSNLYSSVVLAAYLGAELLLNLIRKIRGKDFVLKEYCTDNLLNLLVIICWCITNFLEMTGGRADDMQRSILLNIPLTMVFALVNILGKNIFITILDLVIFVSWYKSHNKILNDAAINFLTVLGLQLIYLTLLSATVEPSYILNPHVSICNLYLIFLAMITCLDELTQANPKFKKAPLILLGTVIFLAIQPGRLFYPYNYSHLDYKQCEALTNDVINQFKTAEKLGEKEVVIELPNVNAEYNWPMPETIGERYADALYKHRVIKTHISVKEVIMTEEKNKQLGID